MATITAADIRSWRKSSTSQAELQAANSTKSRLDDLLKNHGRMRTEKETRVRFAQEEVITLQARHFAGESVDLQAARDRLAAVSRDLEEFMTLPEAIERSVAMRQSRWGEACRDEQRKQAEHVVAGFEANVPRAMRALREALPFLLEIQYLTNIDRADFGDPNAPAIRTLVPKARCVRVLYTSEIEAWLDQMKQLGW